LRSNARLSCIVQTVVLVSLAMLVHARDPVTPGASGAAAPESVLFENLPVVEVATLHKPMIAAIATPGCAASRCRATITRAFW